MDGSLLVFVLMMKNNNEAITLEITCELIGETPQRDGFKVIHQTKEE